jgi:hypothetical protein
MDSLSAVLKHLKDVGWDNEFIINEQGVIVLKGIEYDPNAVDLIDTFRFEGDSDPAEQAIVYVIKTNDGVIGYSIDSYGVYSNHANDAHTAFIQKLSRHKDWVL